MVITPISLKSLSTLSVVISAARQPDSPSSHRRSGWSWSPAGGEEEEEGADPSGRGGMGRSWVTQLLRRNVTAARALRTAAAAASSAGGTRGEMLGWRWTEQWDRAAVFFCFVIFCFLKKRPEQQTQGPGAVSSGSPGSSHSDARSPLSRLKLCPPSRSSTEQVARLHREC